MRAITFQISEDEASIVIASLAELGFLFEPARPVMTTVLDTFDGRLHGAGLRLEVRALDDLELVLSGDDVVPAHLVVAAAPRVPADLPPGPFRSRLSALIDIRALAPQIQVDVDRTTGSWRDPSGKVVATAQLDERIRVVDHLGTDGPTSTIEIHPVTGYDKFAGRAVDVLEGRGLVRCETDTVSLCAAAAHVDLAGFNATATVPLDPSMPAVDGYRAVLANLATVINANWQGTIDQLDTEFLHDLRIAVRRTRTVLGEAKAVLPAAVRDAARDGFKWLAGLTGPARDLDVYLLEWDRYTDPLGAEVVGALVPVRALLERRSADAHAELERALRSEQAADLMSWWTSWLQGSLNPDQLADRSERPLGPVVAKRIAGAHRTVVENGRRIDRETPAEQVHDLRKDAKKLRYLLECFGSLLPKESRKQFVNRLKALQDNLGEHQDAEVHVAMLRSIVRELYDAGASPDTMVAIGQLTERLDQQRLAARDEFEDRFAGFDTRATRRTLSDMLEEISP